MDWTKEYTFSSLVKSALIFSPTPYFNIEAFIIYYVVQDGVIN
jgi:hypothetical protein